MFWCKKEKQLDREVEIEEQKTQGVEFNSDNMSNKLPYSIIIDGKVTGHRIKHSESGWYLSLDLYIRGFVRDEVKCTMISSDNLQGIMNKLNELNNS